MKGIITYLFYILILLGALSVSAQPSNLVRKNLTACQDTVSEGLILFSSVRLLCADSVFTGENITFSEGQFILNDVLCDKVQNDMTCILEYRYLPNIIEISRSYYDTSIMQTMRHGEYRDYTLNPSNANVVDNPLLGTKGIQYNGSFSRGLSVGNSQSLILNSNLDLQMVGDLGDGLLLTAAISDDNLPIQPEGNTQTLQEFDRVFIQLAKDRHKLIAGDFAIQKPKGYFLNYQKKLKGIGGETTSLIGKNNIITTKASVAASRGKFARQFLNIKEGNQGPYRLVGNNNERFIIVLSGSEKVFFNGELLKRGFEYDYIIDYNTADIIFSPQRLITRETRVIVEFEYTDLNYFRTLYEFNTQVNTKNSGYYFNFYSEQDSKTSTSRIELDSIDLRILDAAGDQLDNAVRSGIRPYDETLSETNVGYVYIANTLDPNMNPNEVLKVAADEITPQVFASFSEVGSGKGDYRISNSGINGRVYEYAGKGQGTYLPVIALVPPEQRRSFALGGHYDWKKAGNLSAEISLSDFDFNKLSSVDDADNKGWAGMLNYEGSWKLKYSTGLKYIQQAKIEWVDNAYNILNPYRNAEFNRDWNTALVYTDQEMISTLRGGLSNNKNGEIFYQWDNYSIGNIFVGNRFGLDINSKFKGLEIKGKPSITYTSEGGDKQRKFYRPNMIISQSINKWDGLKIGLNYEGEYNEQYIDDTLDLNSYSFDYLKTFVTTNTDRDLYATLSYNKRVDRFGYDNAIVPALDIDEVEISGNWDVPDQSLLQFSLKGRDYKVTRSELAPGETSKKTILAGIDHQASLWRKVVNATTNYQINSGQEPKLEYVFRKVENIQGEYVYVGSDTASVLNVNDFRFDPSNPSAAYLRIAIPNNEFVRTNNISLNHGLRLEPAKWWVQDTMPISKWRKQISKWSVNSNVRLANKVLDNTGDIAPFDFGRRDSSLVSFSKLMTHSIYFNRSNPKYDITLTYRDNANRNIQVNGYEERGIKETEVRLRWNVWRQADLILLSSTGHRLFDSQLFSIRDFDIQFYKLNPELNYRINTTLRLVWKYRYEKRNQLLNDKESAINHDISFQINKRSAQSSAFDASISLVNVRYNGVANAPIEYDLLDGLKNGKNYLWNLSFTKRVAKNIDITLSYDGRKTGINPIVHLGRMQAKASF